MTLIRGNVSVILSNLSEQTGEIETGNTIAQMFFFLKKVDVDFENVDKFDDETESNEKGFGSTGK